MRTDEEYADYYKHNLKDELIQLHTKTSHIYVLEDLMKKLTVVELQVLYRLTVNAIVNEGQNVRDRLS